MTGPTPAASSTDLYHRRAPIPSVREHMTSAPMPRLTAARIVDEMLAGADTMEESVIDAIAHADPGAPPC